MDWAWFYYCATVLLGKSEKEFWGITPRKLTLLMDQYLKHQKIINGVQPDDEVHDKEAFDALLAL